jgi:hypothetical protein
MKYCRSVFVSESEDKSEGQEGFVTLLKHYVSAVISKKMMDRH